MNDTKTTDVLIVGGGPAGTALAIELVRRGIDVRIVDKAEAGFPGSRAKGIQPRTLEIFEDMEVLDDILSGGSLYPKMGIHLGPFHFPYAMIKANKVTDDVPHPSTWLIPQFGTDRALHDRLASLGCRVEYDVEVDGLEQNDSRVVVRATTPRGPEEISAKYVVGADGGSSIVRKTLGITFEGSTHEEDRMLIVDAKVEGDLARNRWHIWPVGGKFMGACPLPHSELFQWMIKLEPDEEAPTSAEDISARIQARTRKKLLLTDIAWTSVFRPNIRIAESYRKGRVFLVGDAAHVHPPAGAQGLNTGVQDSYNLAWKLAQVLAGASDALLDTYGGERQPIAATVLGISAEKYAGIESASPASLKRGKDEYQLAVTYNGGPLATDGTRTSTLAVGDRAPDATLNEGGVSMRLFDYFRGTHFTAITFGTDQLDTVSWPRSGAGLRTVAIDAPESTADHVAADVGHNFRKSYGVTEPTVFLVRPDGYIAAIAPSVWHTAFSAAVDTVTGLRASEHFSS